MTRILRSRACEVAGLKDKALCGHWLESNGEYRLFCEEWRLGTSMEGMYVKVSNWGIFGCQWLENCRADCEMCTYFKPENVLSSNTQSQPVF